MAPAMGQGGNDTSFGCQQHFSGFSVSINMTPKWKKKVIQIKKYVSKIVPDDSTKNVPECTKKCTT